MFRHFQISEYTVSRGYLHTIFTGSVSHQDFGHLLPNSLAYLLFGRLIEQKFGSRKTFYLVLTASLSSILVITLLEKYFSESVNLITPKWNGTVPATALAIATLIRTPMIYLNPFKLKHSFKNELFMMPMFIPVALFFMLEYYEWQLGYVEYICNKYLARPGHIAAGVGALLFTLKYLK